MALVCNPNWSGRIARPQRGSIDEAVDRSLLDYHCCHDTLSSSIPPTMTIAKRILNLKVIAIMATLLFIVACYFAARKVMASDIELGMERAALIERLGKPAVQIHFSMRQGELLSWHKSILSESVYRHSIIVTTDSAGTIDSIEIVNLLFGHKFVTRKARD